ncbi:MAG: TonB-dependent receptor [Gemmatimonadaceae bacterium]|nr:TonB-dependent receptor [Gemmatimonadaceae bacterium]
MSPATLTSQGSSGAAVDVVVRTDRDAVVRDVTVELRSLDNGSLRATRALRAGVAHFEAVEVGLYRITCRALGFQPTGVDSIVVQLGERLRVPITLVSLTLPTLPTIVIQGAAREAGSGGPYQSVGRRALRQIPLLNRDYTNILAISSQATGRTANSFGGQLARFNSILIDGAAANDLFGVGVTPGSGAGARSLPVEAIEEAQILTAPYDVRHGGFSAGLINGVTRSGSNRRRSAAYALYSRADLTGRDSSGARESAFEQLQTGISSGGPLIADWLHYFGVVEAEHRTRLYDDSPVSDPSTGISQATADRVSEIVRERFGFDPGNTAPVSLRQPNLSGFLKLSWRPNNIHSLTLTHSNVSGRSDALNRSVRNVSNSDGFQLSNSGSVLRTRVETLGLRMVSAWERVTHEAIIVGTRVQDRFDSRSRAPLFLIQADASTNYVAAGSVTNAQDIVTAYDAVELTSTTSIALGTHLVTAGTQNLLVRTHDNFARGMWGVWNFASVDAFARNTPALYEVTLPLNGGPRANMNVGLLSGYVQDRWQLTDAVTLLAGIRYDHSLLNTPPRNPDVASNAALGRINTAAFPKSYGATSPRLSLIWSPGNARRSMLRGGIGTFVGRLPLVWLGNAFLGTGQQSTVLTCQVSGSVPAPTADIANLPRTCITQGTVSKPSVSYFDQGFRMQRVNKVTVGANHEFMSGLSASLDILLSRSRDNLAVTDANLVPVSMNAEGRTMYGSLAANGAARIAARDVQFGPVYRFYNVSGERATTATASLRREWLSRAAVELSYTWSRALDVMSVAGNNGLMMLRNNPIDGSLESRALRRSARDVPHTAVAVTTLPLGTRSSLTLLYRVRSGLPFAYSVSRDVNADGATRNDLAWVPKDSIDITLSNPSRYADLEAFIRSEPCLARARGRLAQRNECRNPPVHALDARILRTITSRGSHTIDIEADLFNVPNALNPAWGRVRESTAREELPLLTVTGFDAVHNRPVYAVPTVNGLVALPRRNAIAVDASRWRAQLGLRYTF